MTDDQLAKELHELKRRRETPLPLIEMFDELLSLAPGLSAKQKRKRSLEIMATALERLERKDARSQPEAGGVLAPHLTLFLRGKRGEIAPSRPERRPLPTQSGRSCSPKAGC
jgi:hypothetical protein